jgi:hypothetical protein
MNDVDAALATYDRRVPATSSPGSAEVSGYYDKAGVLVKIVAKRTTDGRVHYYFADGELVSIAWEALGVHTYAPIYYIDHGKLIGFRASLSREEGQSEVDALNADLRGYMERLRKNVLTSSMPAGDQFYLPNDDGAPPVSAIRPLPSSVLARERQNVVDNADLSLYATEHTLDQLVRRVPKTPVGTGQADVVAGYYTGDVLQKLVATTATGGRVHYFYSFGHLTAIGHTEWSGAYLHNPQSRLYYVLDGQLVGYRSHDLSKSIAQAEVEKFIADLPEYLHEMADTSVSTDIPTTDRLLIDEQPARLGDALTV